MNIIPFLTLAEKPVHDLGRGDLWIDNDTGNAIIDGGSSMVDFIRYVWYWLNNQFIIDMHYVDGSARQISYADIIIFLLYMGIFIWFLKKLISFWLDMDL